MRRRCRRLHPYQGEADLRAYGTTEIARPCPSGKADRHLPQARTLYDRYKASKDKEKFLRGFESEIILFEAAAREIKKAGLTKLPSSDKVKAELEGLSARKAALQTELRKIQREEKEYDTLRQNVDALLERPKEQEQQRQRSNDLE